MMKLNDETLKPTSTSNGTAVPSREPLPLGGAVPLGASAARIFSSPVGPRIFLSPDDPAAPPADPSPPPADPVMPPADPVPSAPQRPDGLPDSFWDEKEGVKFGDLLGQLNELNAFKASIDSKNAAVPEKPEGYELKLPADIKFPEGMSFDLNPDDPMFAFGREVAHKLGLDQPAFEGLIGMYAQREIQQAQALEEAKGRQMEALGPKAQERVGAAKTFLSAKLGPDAVAIFEPVLMLKSGVEAMERLMRIAVSGGGPTVTHAGRGGGDDKKIEGWDKMSPAEKFHAARSRGAGNGK